jgi:hypothetical protein
LRAARVLHDRRHSPGDTMELTTAEFCLCVLFPRDILRVEVASRLNTLSASTFACLRNDR